MDRKELAVHLHENNFNCAQSVACACANVFGYDPVNAFRGMEAFGLGMGCQTTCGAISGMAYAIGMARSDGNLHEPATKQECYAFPDTAILKKAGGDINRVNAKLVIDAAKEGDASALRVFNSFTRYLAMAINNITAFFDPDIIVIGGGVSYAGDFLLDSVAALLPRYQMFKALPIPKLALAKLGNEAGIIGAAAL